MRLKNNSNIELVSFASVNIEEIRTTYTEWLNNINIVQNFGTFNMLLPKQESFIDESYRRFTGEDAIGFFIYDATLKCYIGTCKVDKISVSNRTAELGMMIGEENAHGKGIGKEVFRILLAYCFNVLGMNRVWSQFYSFIIGSQRIVDATGFTYEGTAREAIFRKGKYYDILSYSILKSEYVKE